MATSTLLDTDILIDVSRGVPEALSYLKRLQAHSLLTVSVVTQMELLIGCQNKKELQALDRFLHSFQIIQVNGTISGMAVELLRRYRLSHSLLIADSLIASTALVLNIPLVTKNQRDFRFISGLNLLSYP